ncbi:hypothetical protein Hamer_G019261, partial [Homarus americanus]
MEKQHWSTPIWNLDKNIQYNNKGRRHYVYPDWGNVGAGLEVDPQQHTPLQEQLLEHDPESTRQLTKYRYRTQKDIERKFPLKRTLEFAYPLLSPKKIVSPSKVINSKHSVIGNCLDMMELNGIIYLIHPVWKNDQQQVVASRLSQGGIFCEPSESLEKKNFFKLKKFAHVSQDETISQIVSKEVNNNGYIVIQSQRNAELVSLGERQEFTSSKCDIINNSLISDVDLNDTLPGVWSLASSNGEIYLHDANVERCTWSINLKNKWNESDLSNYQCNFGRHPMSLMVGNESAIWVCDTRIHVDAIHKKQHGVNDNTLRTLLEVREMKKYFADFEKISSFSKLGDMPYVYVVAGSSVFVMDERNCKMPIMNWRHMLYEMPSYTSRLKFGDLDFLMLANKQEKKVSVITSEWITDNYNTWCRGVSLPKHFSIACDTLNFAHKQNLWFGNQVQERFDSSWAGVTSCVNPNDKAGMLFFSLYGNGDIFSQEFRVDQNDTGLPHSEPEDITQYGKDILSRWEEKTVEVSVNKLPNKSFSYYSALPFYQRVTNKTISKELDELCGSGPDFDDILEGLPDIEFGDSVDGKSGSNKMEKLEEEANASDVPDLEFDDDVLNSSRTSKEAFRFSQSLPLPSRGSKTPKRKAKKQWVDGF